MSSTRAVFGLALLAGVALGAGALLVLPPPMPPAPPEGAIGRGTPIGVAHVGDERPVEELATTTTRVPAAEGSGSEAEVTPKVTSKPPPDKIMSRDEWERPPANVRGSQDEIKPKKVVREDGTVEVNFAFLASYTFKFTGEDKHEVPDEVRALSGKTVQVEGFMMPEKITGGMVSRFYLLRHVLGCCFGQPPKINEILAVELPKGEECPALQGTIIVRGPLVIELERDERGEIVGIYRMKATQVSAIR